MAAQLIGTSGRSPRGLLRWSIKATSSLPVPVSPRMRVVLDERLSLRTRDLIRETAALGPTNRVSSASAVRRGGASFRFRSAPRCMVPPRTNQQDQRLDRLLPPIAND